LIDLNEAIKIKI